MLNAVPQGARVNCSVSPDEVPILVTAKLHNPKTLLTPPGLNGLLGAIKKVQILMIN
jgi:hypothetical protein